MIDVLLFNLEKENELLDILDSCKMKYIHVDKNSYNQSFEDILHGKCNNKPCLSTFDDPMMIINAVGDKKLDLLLIKLRSNNINIPLKAILTDSNRKWTPLFLHEQLVKEHLFYSLKI